ncbi:ABC transporter substrate-binding protein (plasmid) [Halarchaeum sp. CBA1220]|uniref:ABC transporter substrate-binding protein n=1 Tax=Halarchaeum sp. CBA1220 TaxID=1853682 RepID=UPI000F3AA6DE|nr:ABC transporter substrate-binding protein [Halarchaeum sp. CBA1220]QLC35598.1 ABC transporter substrate-binding protein [Halarchaeum sp. CBA1220]
MTSGGALVGGGLLAGCTGSGDGATSTTSTTADGTTTTADASYTVSMAPMGDVTFAAVPETIFTRLTHLAGMAFALGRGNDVNALHAPDYYDALWNQFTPRLPGVELDWTGRYSSWTTSKEKLYELDSDVHLADPASVVALDDWNVEDVAEISENVGPWFGNTFSDSHSEPPAAYADAYEYYTLWEQFERVAQVFADEEKYDALAAIHDDVLERIASGLPAEAERPSVVMGGFSDPAAPYVYNVDTPGFLSAHVRPFEPVDAFGDDVTSGSRIDSETLLEADPDVILVFGGMHPSYDMAEIRASLEDDPVASEVTAVQDGRVYAQGARYQGPILNLFQLEMTAKQLYPDAFGEWPAYTEGAYPEIPENERFFDRERVADVINGER